WAGAARAHEGDSDALAGVPVADLLADLVDDPGELVPGHMRQRYAVVVPLPTVPVRAAHARGLDADDGAARRALRLGDLFDPERPAEGVDHDGAHHDSDPPRAVHLPARRVAATGIPRSCSGAAAVK